MHASGFSVQMNCTCTVRRYFHIGAFDEMKPFQTSMFSEESHREETADLAFCDIAYHDEIEKSVVRLASGIILTPPPSYF